MPSPRLITDSIFRDSTFPLQVQYFDNVVGAKQTYHTHAFNELIVVFGGSGKHVIDGEVYQVSKGDVYLIKGSMVHGYSDTDELELVNIYFIPDRLGHAQFDLRGVSGYYALFELEPSLRKANGFKSHLCLDDQQGRDARRLIQRMLDEQDKLQSGYRFLVNALFQQLVVFLARAYSASPRKEARNLINMSRVLTYLETNYQDPDITFEQLAKMAFMSKSTFLRAFKEATGSTPVDYLIHRRIREARDCLLERKLPVSELAENVGFRDSNYFSRKFKEIMGISPAKFRRP